MRNKARCFCLYTTVCNLMAISSNGSFMVASISPSVGSKDGAPRVGNVARDCLSVRLRYTARRPRSAKLLGVTLARPDEALFLLPSPGLPTPTEDARPPAPAGRSSPALLRSAVPTAVFRHGRSTPSWTVGTWSGGCGRG